MKHARSVWFLLFGVAAIALAGCGKEEPIRVYETAAAPRPQTLEVPKGWRRVEPDQFSLYAFEAGLGGELVRITISSAGGGLLANVNRWRVQQLSLPAVTERDLPDQLTPLKIDQYSGHYVELIAPETPAAEPPAVDDAGARAFKPKPKVREAIYGAIIAAKGRDWFFKLKGPVAAAEREKAAFKSFVDSGLRAIALAVHEPQPEEKTDGR